MQITKKFVQRAVDPSIYQQAAGLGLTELQSLIVAGRITHPTDDLKHVVSPSLLCLKHPEILKDCLKASERIAEAIIDKKTIGIVTDYDVDGICSHALTVEAFDHFCVPRSHIQSFIGHRLEDGYGLSVNVAYRILASEVVPDIVITADCGISDQHRIEILGKRGIDVIVTDHHAVPPEGIPVSSYAVVNPCRKDCPYPDKSISGCMVTWLVMCQVRNVLIEKGWLPENNQKLGFLLDYVALSTIADAVALSSPANRAVVLHGLHEINYSEKPAWKALAQLCGLKSNGVCQFSVEDLGFQIGPRINAQGRVDHGLVAVEFFLSKNLEDAFQLLAILDTNNQKRQSIEKEMVEKAEIQARKMYTTEKNSLVISDASFHAGIQGIVASRLLDTFGIPTVILSPMPDSNLLAGSARTTPSIHIRNVLQEVADRFPGIICEFGGHRGAAGVKIESDNLDTFDKAFESVISEKIKNEEIGPIVLTDGELPKISLNMKILEEIRAIEPYGNKFEQPVFEGVFRVKEMRILGKEPIHLSLTLEKENEQYKAIWFRALKKPDYDVPFNIEDTIRCVYKLKLNVFMGKSDLQLIVVHAQGS